MQETKENMSEKQQAVIIGAGPAGLTAAYELLVQSDDYRVIVLEESAVFGGISRTVNYKGNRMDMGGHRFFSKVPEVNAWWETMLPTQGALARDDKELGRSATVVSGGPDPEKADAVMLRRNRLSRIFFNQTFFDYPISLKFETLKNMGFATTMVVGFSYLKSALFKRQERSLEDFYINRFGKKLYSMFFEHYTENLWGRHPREISPEWGAQRVKGLSVFAILGDMLSKAFGRKGHKVETSLIEEFAYPKYGPGQLWDITAEKIQQMGGEIITEAKAVGFSKKDCRLTDVIYEKNNMQYTLQADVVLSSMPLKDFAQALSDMPEEPKKVAEGLPYRDYMTVGVLVPHLKLKNKTNIPTVGNIVPDNWVYVHEKGIQMGRFQIYNNWSPYLVEDLQHTVWVGLEYFCDEGDATWTMGDEAFARQAIKEMVELGLIEKAEDVLDYHVEYVKKAYPAYFDTYEHIDVLRDYLDTISNLYCIGRNGQHRYNNIDHSMCTSFEAVKNILGHIETKENIWNVNTEKEYHESKS